MEDFMMWAVRACRCRPYVFGTTTTAAGTGLLTRGAGIDELLATSNSDATGNHILKLRKESSRDSVVVATKDSSDVAANAYVYEDSSTPTNELILKAQASGGAGDDGTIHTFGIKFDSRETIALLPRGNLVRSSWDRGFIFGADIDGTTTTPTIISGKRYFTVTKASTGVYTILFKNLTIGSTPIVIATAQNAAKREVGVSGISTAGFTCTTTSAGVAADIGFSILVYASQATAPLARQGDDLLCPFRKARLVFAKYEYSGSTPSLVTGYGSDEFSFYSYSTGRVYLQFTTDYSPRRIYAGAVICNGTAGWGQLGEGFSAFTTTSPWIIAKTFDNSGSAADINATVIALVSDDPSEY